jgi:hypothetical protein
MKTACTVLLTILAVCATASAQTTPAGSAFPRGDRPFISHGGALDFNLRGLAMQRGAHGLPVIVDQRGTMREIEPPECGASGHQLVLNAEGEAVEFERIALSPQRKALFFDAAGNVIEGARPLINKDRQNLREDLIVAKFMLGKTPLYLDFLGNIVNVDADQC